MIFNWKKASVGAFVLTVVVAGGLTVQVVSGSGNSDSTVAGLLTEQQSLKSESDSLKVEGPALPTQKESESESTTDRAVLASRSGMLSGGSRQEPPQIKQTTPSTEKKTSVAASSGTKILNMKATAYGPGNINWKFDGKTYAGTQVRQGVIAVDPNVIPLGTRVWVSGYNHPNLPANGFMAVAEDIGGAIRGDRIDIYINADTQSIRNFGIQNVQVRIMDKK